MYRSRWSGPSPGDDNCYDYCRWDSGCFGFVGLACNSQPFGCVAVSWCVVMSTIDQHTMIAAAAAEAADGCVGRRSCCV